MNLWSFVEPYDPTATAVLTTADLIGDDRPCPDGHHVWTGRQMGGSPDVAESHEWVEYCDACGLERPCDD